MSNAVSSGSQVASAIFINAVRVALTVRTLSGIQLKGLVQQPPHYQLFLEGSQAEPDRLIGDHESVQLRDGMHFYTVPPAAFGNA